MFYAADDGFLLEVFGVADASNPRLSLSIAAPEGQMLTPGVYNATRFRSATAGTLDVSGNGRGCNSTTGTFVVHEATISGGVVSSLAVDFEQHCETQTDPPQRCASPNCTETYAVGTPV
jgi:hypothetical protein